MSEVPSLHVLSVVDLLFFVVLNHVAFDKLLSYGSRLNKFRVLLDLLSDLESFLNFFVIHSLG